MVGVQGWDNSFSYLIEENDSYNLNKKDEQGASLKTGVGIGFGLSKSMALTIDFENTKIAGVNTNSVGVNCLLRLQPLLHSSPLPLSCRFVTLFPKLCACEMQFN